MTGVIKLDIYKTSSSIEQLTSLYSVVIPRVGESITLPDGISYEVHSVDYQFKQGDWIRPEVVLHVSEG